MCAIHVSQKPKVILHEQALEECNEKLEDGMGMLLSIGLLWLYWYRSRGTEVGEAFLRNRDQNYSFRTRKTLKPALTALIRNRRTSA